MRKLVEDLLQVKGSSVMKAANGGEAVDISLTQKNIALILLDMMMPKIDGWEVCEAIRQYLQVPIIMLTARSEERNELQSFSLGTDEYISKPFSPKTLAVRMEAILRRSKVVSSNVIDADGICINKAAHQATIDSEPVDLSYEEFEFLTYFMENQGLALSREKILNNTWNYDCFGNARAIDTHVEKLCSKLGSKEDYIKTIWGIGYRFEMEA